jgi:hypothetical protein
LSEARSSFNKLWSTAASRYTRRRGRRLDHRAQGRAAARVREPRGGMGVARQDRADRERELMRAMAINKLKGTDLRRSKPGMIGDGGGLWLQTTPAKHGAA